MDNTKYRLEYKGKAISMTFGLYPYYSSKKITLSKNNKFYYFTNSDLLNADAITYYKSLAPEIALTRFNKESSAKESAKAAAKESVKEKKVEEKKPEIKKEVEPLKVELPKEIVEEVSFVRPEDKKDKETEKTLAINDESLNQEVVAPAISENEITEADICEYLDLNYTEEEIKALAVEFKINVKRIRTKSTIIAKIAKERPADIIAKIENKG